MSATPAAGVGRTTVSKRAWLILSLLVRLLTTIDVWIERSRQRHALGELAGNDHLLADIGLSLEQARREARKARKEAGNDVHHVAQKPTDRRAVVMRPAIDSPPRRGRKPDNSCAT
jgi:uncharacterized protein YjiS (DUF1127 family)